MIIKLKNGLRVIYEKIPYVKSVSVGVWVGAGSRLENEHNNGISHFIEHMLFKGTEKRSAAQIAKEMDFIGGNLNAFTLRECTCFYAKAIDENLEKVIDILSDMCLYAKISERDTELERGVILEEISMYEDSPEDVVMELLAGTAWKDSPLGYSISGTSLTVSEINSRDMHQYMEKYYNAQNCVLAVAGNFDEKELLELAEKYFGGMRQGANYTDFPKTGFYKGKALKYKDIEQTHLCIGYEAMPQDSPDIYALAVLNSAFGSGMSSRLFQKIREEKGLAYSVYSAADCMKDTGLMLIYAGLSPENTEMVLEMIMSEIKLLLQGGLEITEFERGKSQIKSSYIMGLESVSGHMNAIGKGLLLQDMVKTSDEVIHGIETVSEADVQRVTESIFGGSIALAIVSPQIEH